ncbi:WSC domain-containing protein 1, partial [Stegodyphus mimosarum]
MESILDWLQFEGPLLIIRYEAITVDLPGELVRLLKFLEANVSWNAFQCVIRNRDGIFRRSKKHLNFEPFDNSLKRVVDGYKTIVQTALRCHEQGIKFDITNTTVLHNVAINGTNLNISVLPMTYVEKDQNENTS